MTIGLGPVTELTADECWQRLEAHSLGFQTSVPLIAVYTGQSPSGSGLLISRK